MYRAYFTAVVLLANLCGAGGARADCYDILGCTNKDDFSRHFSDYLASAQDGPNCEFLYQMRNLIFKEHGYCFVTQRAIAALGNEGCHVRSLGALGLSPLERKNAATILQAERRKGCGE